MSPHLQSAWACWGPSKLDMAWLPPPHTHSSKSTGVNQEPLWITLWKSQVPSACWVTLDFLLKSRQSQDCSWSSSVWLNGPWTKLNVGWAWAEGGWERLSWVPIRISLLKRQCHTQLTQAPPNKRPAWFDGSPVFNGNDNSSSFRHLKHSFLKS